MSTRVILFISCFFLAGTVNLFSQARYYKAETHCHSSNSGDGFISPTNLLQQYKNRGYEIVFMSDHDTLTDAGSLNIPGMLAINAIEMSCGSHFNGFNMTANAAGCGKSNQEKVDAILEQGGLVCVNHPVAPRWRITAEEILALEGELSFIEIYNPTDIYEAADDQSLWDSLLTAGLRIWGIASGDVHQFYPLENLWLGWIMVKLEELNKEAVLDAMLRGDFYSSTGVVVSENSVSGDTMRVACTNCVKIIFWGEEHTKLKQVNKQTAEYIRQPGDKYVRAELVFDRFNKAWTQPVFFDGSPTGITDQQVIQVTEIYPNPNSGQFSIAYFLNERTHVKTSLFDLQGREVVPFPVRLQDGGWHRSELSADGLAPGTYLLVLSGDRFRVARKVVVF